MKIKISVAVIFISISIFLLSFISFIFYKTGERFLLSETYNSFKFLSLTKANIEFKKSILFIFISAILISIILGIAVSYFLSKPIENIIKASDKVIKSGYIERVNIKQKNELAALSELINQMANEVESTREELKRSNKIINQYAYFILHDFKNPIISLAALNQMLREQFGDKISKEGKKILDMQQSKIIQLNQLIQNLQQVKIDDGLKEKEIPLNDDN